MLNADVGVFGGSGFYRLLEDVSEHRIDTPYGPPSDAITIGTVGTHRVAFLPRHGRHHTIPPHRIPFRANLWAMREVGVRWLFGPCAVGSLQPHVRPGDFVLCDQFVDRTSGRTDTFYDGPVTTHVSAADPYCPTLRALVADVARSMGLPLHERGTVVVIQGPRFSTRAESRWFRSQGWEVVNMTQYPEAWLARELALCYVNISLVTDYDVGVPTEPDRAPVTADEVMKQFAANNAKLRDLILAAIDRLPERNDCPLCPRALDGARVQ